MTSQYVLYDIARDAHCDITMSNNAAMDTHCDVTMSNYPYTNTTHSLQTDHKAYLFML